MRIVFDEGDKALAEKTRNGENHLQLYLFGKDSEKCSLEFKINDPYKAQVFLSQLQYDLSNYLKEECGCEIISNSLIGVHSDLQNLQDDINKAIGEVFRKHNL